MTGKSTQVWNFRHPAQNHDRTRPDAANWAAPRSENSATGAESRPPGVDRPHRGAGLRSRQGPHVEEVLPALARDVVVCDRYVDSMIAATRSRSGARTTEVEQVARWATAGCGLDLTVLLRHRPRRGGREAGNRIVSEAAGLEFHRRLRIFPAGR